MARLINKEKFFSRIPEEFHKILKKDDDYDFVTQLWKMDDEHLKVLLGSIPEKLKPIFDWRINKPAAKRGNRSNLPYSTEDIKRTTSLMKMEPGATIITDDDIEGTVLTVQILVKIQVGDAIKTASISSIKEIR